MHDAKRMALPGLTEEFQHVLRGGAIGQVACRRLTGATDSSL